jgi:hypothetical protein
MRGSLAGPSSGRLLAKDAKNICRQGANSEDPRRTNAGCTSYEIKLLLFLYALVCMRAPYPTLKNKSLK